MIKSTFNLERKLIDSGYDFVIGVDEAGRGPLAGPVVACACTLKSSSPSGRGCRETTGEGNNLDIETSNFPSSTPRQSTFSSREKGDSVDLIRDSKTLSHKQREGLFDFIQEHFHVGVGICDHETIDRMNILEATYLAMKKSLASLMREISNLPDDPPVGRPNSNPQNTKYKIQYNKYIILLDGNKPIPNFSAEQKAIVNGDKLVKSISAASIIAKVTRDRIMLEMHEKYPQYKFDKHKGYGTKLHFEMLKIHGPCKIHRRSFSPVSKSLHQLKRK